MRWRLSGAISEGHLRGSGGGVCGVTARRCGPSVRPCRVREHARCCACSRGPAGHANLRYGRRVGRALKLELSVRTTHALDLGPGLAARARTGGFPFAGHRGWNSIRATLRSSAAVARSGKYPDTRRPRSTRLRPPRAVAPVLLVSVADSPSSVGHDGDLILDLSDCRAGILMS